MRAERTRQRGMMQKIVELRSYVIFMVGIGLLALLASTILYSLSPKSPVMLSDSETYLNFTPERTAGYPLFLRLTGIGNIIAAQIFLYGLCVWLLGIVLLLGCRSASIAITVTIALFINPEVNAFHSSVLTESLFLSVEVLLLAACVALVVGGNGRSALIASFLAALAVTVRPVAYPLILVVAAGVVFRLRAEGWRYQGRVLLGCLLVWSAVVSGERLYARSIHGDQLTSLVGSTLFAKAALIASPPLDVSSLSPVAQRLARALEVDYAPVREVLSRANGTTAHPALLAAYEACIQHGCTARFRSEYGVSIPEFNSTKTRVGSAWIRQSPLGFTLLTWNEYQNLWALNSRTHPWLAPEYDAFIASARPLPLEDLLSPMVVSATSPSRVAYVVRPAFIAAGVVIALITVCFGYAAAGRSRSDALILSAFLSALAVELVFAFTAIAGVGYGRYTMAMWPNVAVAIIVAVGVICAKIKQARGASQKQGFSTAPLSRVANGGSSPATEKQSER